VLVVGGWAAASASGGLERLKDRLFPGLRPRTSLSPGDFPAGVMAPGEDVASLPLRPTVIGFIPRGSAAALLLAAGGAGPDARPGVLRTAYALDVRAVPFLREEELVAADEGLYPLGCVVAAGTATVDAAAVVRERLQVISLGMPRAVSNDRRFEHAQYFVERRGRPIPCRTAAAWRGESGVLTFL